MDSGLKSVTGIVARQYGNVFFVWCKESYPGKDGIIAVETARSLKVGDWLNLKFTQSEYQRYFPTPKNPNSDQFQTSNYEKKPEKYDTKQDGDTIIIQLELYLLENQTEIDHSFFGKIYNNRNLPFPTGKHLVTIRRVCPKPYMESVWVIERVDPAKPKSSEVELIGIVAGQDETNWFVWNKERPAGKEITISKANSTLAMGSWVQMTIPRENMDIHLLECTKFTKLNKSLEIHPTQVIGKTISLKLKCSISENSTVIHHEFVGSVINDKADIKRSGTYEITIVRKLAKKAVDGTETVWRLMGEPKLLQEDGPVDAGHRSRVDQPRNMNRARSQSRNGRSKMITGIVVSDQSKHLFVWCKERLAGYDAKLPKTAKTASLKTGDFIQFSISVDQEAKFFPPNVDANGYYPEFNISDFIKIDPKFEIFTSGFNKNTVNIILEVDIQQTGGDISHEFLGLVINDKGVRFDTPGRYKLTIVRRKTADAPIQSVWFLKSSVLVHSQPGQQQQQQQQQQQNLVHSMENLNLAPTQSPSILKRSPSRHRSQSRGRVQFRDGGETPIPAPRTSLDGNPPQNHTVESGAIILNIVSKQGQQQGESINVWILKKKKPGFLNLHVPAEKQNLKIGTVFTAKFTENANGKWKAWEVSSLKSDEYETGLTDDRELKISVHVEHWTLRDEEDSHRWADHEHFGKIIDIHNLLEPRSGLYDRIWIKQSKVQRTWEWVVHEVDQKDSNNTNH